MKRYLILSDGSVFEGEAAGADGTVIGEVVFNTSVVGYMETLTDPAYYGQIITQTFPIIGGYGQVEPDGGYGKVHARGYIVRELMDGGSNFRKEAELNDYLAANGVVCITGIDTRALTRKLRDHGVMNGMICGDVTSLDKKLREIKAFSITQAVAKTASTETVTYGSGGKKIALWDFGCVYDIIGRLTDAGYTVVRVPHTATADDIAALGVSGVVLSGGAGNPAELKSVIAEVAKVCSRKIPVLGVGLGHQLLALSQGARTVKLKYGHRGGQPVKDTDGGRVYITVQNHGYAVSLKGLPDGVTATFVNANDKTCEGLSYKNIPALSTQFIPSGSNPLFDTAFIYDRFYQLIARAAR